MISISIRSSDAVAALEYLHELRFCENNGGIQILIGKIEEGMHNTKMDQTPENPV